MQPTFSVWPLVAGQLVKVGMWPAILGEDVGSGYVHVYMQQPMTRLVVAKTAVTSSEHLPVPQDFDVLPYVIAKEALTHENDELRVCCAEANRNLELVLAEYESIERQLLAQSDYGNEIEYTLKLAQANHETEVPNLYCTTKGKGQYARRGPITAMTLLKLLRVSSGMCFTIYGHSARRPMRYGCLLVVHFVDTVVAKSIVFTVSRLLANV